MYEVNIAAKRLVPLRPVSFAELNLMERYDLQEWVVSQPGVLGEDLLVISKELTLPSTKRLDLLALDLEGHLVIVEMKRDDSGTEADWQAIKYASYCANFTNEAIYSLFATYSGCEPESAREQIADFLGEDDPELNLRQRIIICSKEFNGQVASAALWLRDCGVDIACVKLSPGMSDDNRLFLHPNVIIPLPEAKDYIEKRERKAKATREKPDFSDYVFVNVGADDGDHRSWQDSRRYGYVAAGHGMKYANQLSRLSQGDKIFAYVNGRGYVGYGHVTGTTMPIGEFVDGETGKQMADLPLVKPGALDQIDDPEMAEYVVPVKWIETVDEDQAYFQSGMTVLRNIVGRLRLGDTVDFLEESFGIRERK